LLSLNLRGAHCTLCNRVWSCVQRDASGRVCH